jgi:xylulokinase
MAGAQATGALGQVRAIGVSGQQHGLVVLDESLRVIRPAKLWNDTETAPENEELLALFGGPGQWMERFGIVPLTGYTVSKLLWLKKHEPENFARVRHVLLPHEYLNWWLTGELCAEAGDASGTAYFDPRSRTWATEVLDTIDGGSGQLRTALPRLVAADECVGTVRPAVAAELGVPVECVVAAGGGDNMMGAIGTENVKAGVVTISLGTSSTVYSFASEPVADAAGSIAPFCSSSGGWLPLVCTMNATNVVTNTVQMLGRTVQDIDAALDMTPPGADGLVFLPFLNGERTPDLPTARGTLAGISATNFTADHMIRAAVEGVTFGILHGLDLILGGRTAEVLQVIGGGARSAGWRQLLADATGTPVQVPAEAEAGCLGATIQARVAWSRLQGRQLPFPEAAAACAYGNEASGALPRVQMKQEYEAARAMYRKRMKEIYGVS